MLSKTMVRRSARLRNKTTEAGDELNQKDGRESTLEDLVKRTYDQQEMLENMVKRTYNFIKEKAKARFDHEDSRSDVPEEKEDTQEKAEDFISISSRLETSISDCQTLASELNPGLDLNDLYFKMDQSNSKAIPSPSQKLMNFNEKQVMKKSVINPDFEKQQTAPQYHVSQHALKKQKKKEKEKSAGRNWFDMPAPEMTQELQRDLNILRMRNVLDPKRHYKKNNSKKLPKYFQLGTVVSGPAEFYSSRIPKRERKGTIVESLLADAQFRRYNKRKFLEIQASKEIRKKGFFWRTKRRRR